MSWNKIKEKYGPIFFAIIVTILFWYSYDDIKKPNELIKSFVDSSFVVDGVLLGFLLTISTIINTINTRRMNFVRSMGGYDALIRYMKIAIYFNIIGITIAFLVPFFNFIYSVVDPVYYNSFIVFILSLSWFVNIRFTLIFISLIIDKE